MKQFGNYEEAKKSAQATGTMKLPVGAYVCKILSVKYETFDWGDVIALAFDIIEGDQKGFFRTQYDNNQNEDKKWKGSVRINVPKDDGSEQDGWTKRSFAGWVDAFEKSNAGYLWDWDEKKWKDKVVGIVFGETGAVINGRDVVFTEARFAVEADKVRKGTAPEAKFKARKGYPSGNNGGAASDQDGFLSVPAGTDEEIPF